jgi:glycosyltransferase involved in cell wall biosynthesis
MAVNVSAFPELRQQILVDVSVISGHDARTGIQRVVRAIWLALQNLTNDRLVVRPVFATSRRGYCYAAADFLTSAAPEPDFQQYVSVKPGDIFLGLDLAAHLMPKHESQIASWQTAGAKIHMMVYDLLPYSNPQWFSSKLGKNFRIWLEFLARRADTAICISANVADELKKYLASSAKFRSKKIAIKKIRLGSDITATAPNSGRKAAEIDSLELLKEQPIILMVGTIEPRKGYSAALDTFEWLWQNERQSSPNLVIVGKSGWKTKRLQSRMSKHAQLGKKFLWLTDASDELLQELYATSAGYLAMSRGEGFGLPIAEALSHGLPVLARDIPVFREHAADRVGYFSDETPFSLGARIVQLAKTKSQPGWQVSRPEMITWSQTMEDLLNILGLSQIVDDVSTLGLSAVT